MNKSEKNDRSKSPCCQAPWLWRTIQGIRLWKQINGRKIYDVKCSKCRLSDELDYGKVSNSE